MKCLNHMLYPKRLLVVCSNYIVPTIGNVLSALKTTALKCLNVNYIVTRHPLYGIALLVCDKFCQKWLGGFSFPQQQFEFELFCSTYCDISNTRWQLMPPLRRVTEEHSCTPMSQN